MTAITFRLLVGIAIALMDYYYSIRKCRLHQGSDYSKNTLEAIELILDQQGSATNPSTAYDDAISKVKVYLIAKGMVQVDIGLLHRFKLAFSRVSCKEIVNGLSLPSLLILAAVLEISYDFLIGIHIASEAESGIIYNLISDLYQIPLLFVGLLLGRVIKDLWQFSQDNGETQKIEDTIQQCIKNTPLLSTILKSNSSGASDSIQQNIQSYKIKLTRAGTKFYKQIDSVTEKVAETAKTVVESAKGVADDIVNYQESQKEKHEKDKETRSKQFDDITKGR